MKVGIIMDGYFYLEKGDFLERTKQESGSISLLAKQGDFEVMEQAVHKGKEFCIYPGSSKDLVEFFYVLEGEILNDYNGKMICTGDIFYFAGINEPMYFSALTECRFLYVVNTSVFVMISDNIKNMHRKLRQVEEKDKYTEKHSNRVQELSVSLLKKYGDEGVDLLNLSFASLFHDLGKIDIPDEILLKPGKLNDEEYEIIKQHPQLGKDLSKDLSYVDMGEIIEQHHERIDGNGYPKGLKGDEIRIEAKIIAIVDSFDAMTSDRAYRKGMSTKDALIEIQRCAGTHFDPQLVKLFVEMVTKDYFVKENE